MLKNLVRIYAFKGDRLYVETTGCALQKGGKRWIKKIKTGTLSSDTLDNKEVIGFSTLK